MGNVNENIAGKWERSWHCATMAWHFQLCQKFEIRFHFFSQMLSAHKEGNQIVT